jgi:hypothetical protein
MAAKFIVHVRIPNLTTILRIGSTEHVIKDLKLTVNDKQFIGDIHQPLHDENYEKGGNGIRVIFDGKPTNLHAVWDTSMPEKLIGGYSLADAQRWASSLDQEILTGTFKPYADSWLLGMDISDPVSSTMIWAREANTYVCSTVMPNGAAALDGMELDGDYYTSAIPIVQLQIARAGYRYISLTSTRCRGH